MSLTKEQKRRKAAAKALLQKLKSQEQNSKNSPPPNKSEIPISEQVLTQRKERTKAPQPSFFPKDIHNYPRLRSIYYNSRSLTPNPNLESFDKNLEELFKNMTSHKEEKPFKASNFSATSFSASTSGNLLQAAQVVKSVSEGNLIHPKRFAPFKSSTVYRIGANSQVSLTNLTAGHIVYVVSPISDSHKGSFILSRNPDSPTDFFSHAVVAPDRDVETLGQQLANLFVSMDLSAPLIVGGSSVIVAQMTSERGIFPVNPLSIRPGKAEAVSIGKSAIKQIISNTPQNISFFTAAEPDIEVLRNSRSDLPNTGLVMGTSIESDTLGVSSPSAASNLEIFSRYQSAAGYGWLSLGDGLTLTTANQQIFSGKQTGAFLKSVCFGRVKTHVKLVFRTVCPDAGLFRCLVGLRTTVVYPTSTSTLSQSATIYKPVVYDTNTNGLFTSIDFHFDTLDHPTFASTVGRIISSITFEVVLPTAPAAGHSIILDQNDGNTVSISLPQVSARTKYAGYMISGATSAVQLNLSHRVHTEVMVNNSSINSQFVEVNSDPPYEPRSLILASSGHLFADEDEKFTASSFSNVISKVYKFIKPLASEALKAGGKALVHSALPFLGSASSIGKFSFPLVREHDVQNFEVAHGVFPENAEALKWLSEQRDHPQFEGRSYTGALLLKTLNDLFGGIHPGCYSFEVSDAIQYRGSINFLILPIDKFDLKVNLPVQSILGLTPKGWYNKEGKVSDSSLNEIMFSDHSRFQIKRYPQVTGAYLLSVKSEQQMLM